MRKLGNMTKHRKVALVNPPSPFLIDDLVMPPLGIMGLSSYLKERGIDTCVVDMPSVGIEKCTERCIDESITHCFFTATTPQYESAIKLMNLVKEARPDMITVIGGAHATFRSDECKHDGFDYVVVGEGEIPSVVIVNNLSELPIDEKKNCLIMTSSEQIDIDSLPLPDRDFDGFEKYSYDIDGLKATTMFTTRGCPYSCAFCAKMFHGVRQRSAGNVLEEVDVLRNDYGFRAIMFFDDTFTLKRDRLSEICYGMYLREMKWRCFIHANSIDMDTLTMMKECGCVEVGMGLESANDNILETINKRATVSRMREVINMCHEVGIRIKVFTIIGLPGETRETADNTLDFLLETKPDSFDLTIFTPYPGSDIWNNPDKYDIGFDKFKTSFDEMFYKGRDGEYVPMVHTSELTPGDIENLRETIVSTCEMQMMLSNE